MGVKVGPGTRDPPQSLKVEPHDTSSKFKSGTPGTPSKFKSETPSPFFNEFIFFRIFHLLFTDLVFLSFLNKKQKISTVSNRNQLLQRQKVYITTKWYNGTKNRAFNNKKKPIHLHIKTRPPITWFNDIMRQALKCTQGKKIFCILYHINCPSECLLE